MDPADHIAIQTLIYRYCDHLDRGDLKAMAQLFANATVHMPGLAPYVNDAAGIQAIYEKFTRIYPETGTPRTRHVTTNVIVEPEGHDKARAQSYVTVFQATEKLLLQPVIAGSNYDKFARVNGVWRFSERRIDTVLFGDLSQHMLVPFGPTMKA